MAKHVPLLNNSFIEWIYVKQYPLRIGRIKTIDGGASLRVCPSSQTKFYQKSY